MKNKYGLVVFASVFGLFHGGAVAADATLPGVDQALSAIKGESSGPQLNRTLEMMERARVAQQMEEDRNRQRQKIENPNVGEQQEQKEELTFVLKKVDYGCSEVLFDYTIDAVINQYVGKKVQVKDLYKMLERINKLYAEGGYITCKAFLPPQKIENGVVKIVLVEGKTGNVLVNGNRTTRTSYIKRRIKLPSGKVVRINDLNKKMMLFNGTNDVQLRLMLQAGKEPGTTDFVLTAYEPQQISNTLFSDNSGNYTSGMYRIGYFLNVKSVSGIRDNITLGTIYSQGTRSFSAIYSVPVSPSGTQISLGYSTNATKIIRGELDDAGLNVKGHSVAYSVMVRQPWIVNDTTRSEAGLEFNHQNSKSSIEGYEYVRDLVRGVNSYFSHTTYGKSHVFYQKHSYSLWEKYSDSIGTQSLGGIHFYKLNTYFQKAYRHGQMFTNRFDTQLNQGKYLPSSLQFYIGGSNSVRGYRESYLSGERGFSNSLEYQVPFKDRRFSVYGFYDYGIVKGASAFENHVLHSVGAGLKASWNKHIYSGVCLAFPLLRDINENTVSKTRIHFMISGQF